MITVRQTTLRSALLGLALTGAVAACSSDATGNGDGSAVIGTWNAATFVVGGTDLIAAGMGLSFSFNLNGTYSITITNDQGGLCDTGVNCTDGGDYTATDTQITLDPGTTDPATLNYTVSGNTMTVNAVIDGTPLTATFDKQ